MIRVEFLGLEAYYGMCMYNPVVLRWRESNDMRNRTIIRGVVPNHRSRACQQQPSKMLCHLPSSKAVGHPLTPFLVERYVIRTSYRDNASCKSRRNITLFFLYISKIS